MANKSNNLKSLVSVDWTGIQGETPFYEPESGSKNQDGYRAARYGVAVDTGIVNFQDLPASPNAEIEKGAHQILEFYNKHTYNPAWVYASIPGSSTGDVYNVTGTFVPIRPSGTIKVLVTIPAEPDGGFVQISRLHGGRRGEIYKTFLDLPSGPSFMAVGAYDEIQINTYNLTKRADNVAKLLNKYDKSVRDFEGRIYDFDFSKQATKVINFASLLGELVVNNQINYTEDGSDLIMVGVSSSYATPLYAQINKGEGFRNLEYGFNQFRKSPYVDANTLFIYKNFDSISSLANDVGASTPSSLKGDSSVDWQSFLSRYIVFPTASIEYTSGRPQSPEPNQEIKKETRKSNESPVKDASRVKEEEWRLQQREFKKAMEARQKASRDWIGDNVLGNLDKTIHQMHRLEDMYHQVLDKIGITYIVRAAMRCLALDLPIDDIKDFLRDVRNFTADVIEILKIPVITLDDIIPTVDIMGDILEQVFWAVYEAVKKALWEMLKNIIYTLLDNCDDPCAAGYGGVQIGALLQKGGLKELGKGLAAPALATVGSAALGGVKNGLASQNLSDNSQKFLGNINKKISSEQIETLTAPLQGPAGDAASAISNSKIGKFFEEASSTLTCGETNKLLQGKASPAASKIIQNLASKDPVLKELLGDGDSINDFFESAGKLIDQDDLDAQIEEASQIFPDPTGCLSDRQDSELRCALLQEKGVPADWCVQQDDKSRERAIERVNQLQSFLDDPNTTLQDAIPPIFCTYKDGKLVEGLVSNDHPSFQFMMKTTLDTTFDGVYNAFNYDVLRVPEVMQMEVPGPNQVIPRVLRGVPDNAGGVRGMMINPEFEMAIKSGYSVTPEYWTSPPWDDAAFGGGIAVDPSPDEIQNGRIRTCLWNLNKPPLIKPTTKIVFCPGMSGSDGAYAKFQTGYLYPRDNEVARERLDCDNRNLQMSVPNTLKSDIQNFAPPGGVDVLQRFVSNANKTPELQSAIASTGLQNFFGPNQYALSLTSFDDAKSGMDKFSIRIVGDYASGVDAQIYRKLFEIDMPQAAKNVSGTSAPSNRNLNGFSTSIDSSTKEKQFVQFLQKIWTQGENIYTGSVNNLVKVDKPSYGQAFLLNDSRGLLKDDLLTDQNEPAGIKSLYEELLRDLMASCLTEVKDSKLIEENAANLYSVINFAPLQKPHCPDISLLRLEEIKDIILEQYKTALCIENSLPNTTGLGDNRDNALEAASLFGVIKATVRLYALEITLKTLMTFSELQSTDLDDVFLVYLREHMTAEIRAKGYLDDFMRQTVKAYNLYAESTEGRAKNLPREVTDFNEAIRYFLKNEMDYAVRRILIIAGLCYPEKSINELLINANSSRFSERGWLSELEAGDSIVNLAASGRDLGKVFHVPVEEEIVGIKDWTNGSFVMEKYIRVVPTAWGIDESGNISDQASADLANFCTQVFNVKDFWGQWSRIFGSANSRTWPVLPAPLNPSYVPGSGAQTQNITIEGDDECSSVDATISVTIPGTPESSSRTLPPQHTISRYFQSIRFGLRLVCKSGDNTLLSTDMSPSLNPLMPPLNYNFDKALRNKTYIVQDLPATPPAIFAQTGTAITPDYNRFCFPVCCAEIAIQPDKEINSITSSEFFSQGYQNVYPTLLSMLKNTDEYKFMFDYCFPLKRLVSLAALYNSAYVLPFPGLNDVFTNTKEQLRMSFVSMLKSGNYLYKDPTWTQKNLSINIANGQEIPGLDFGKMALQFIFGIFKGLGEAFSPNIAIAKKIQMAAKMIGPLLVKSINKAKEVGNRADELAGGSGNAMGSSISECDLPDPFPLPEIPMLLISLGLVPMDIFFPLPGPPLGPLGMIYLTQFGTDVSPGSLILGKSATEKEQERCNIKGTPTNPGMLPDMLSNSGPDCGTEADCLPPREEYVPAVEAPDDAGEGEETGDQPTDELAESEEENGGHLGDGEPQQSQENESASANTPLFYDDTTATQDFSTTGTDSEEGIGNQFTPTSPPPATNTVHTFSSVLRDLNIADVQVSPPATTSTTATTPNLSQAPSLSPAQSISISTNEDSADRGSLTTTTTTTESTDGNESSEHERVGISIYDEE